MHFTGIYFRINTDFLQISLFYADFDGISEKSTFREISKNSRNSQKLVPVKISTIKVVKLNILNFVYDFRYNTCISTCKISFTT